MSWRLDRKAPDLARALQDEPERALRLVAERVVLAAVRTTGLVDDRITSGIDALRSGQYGETDDRLMVKAAVRDLDEVAWELQGAVDAGRRTQDEYIAAFERARAASALWFALDSDPLGASMDAAYEAMAATSDELVRREIADQLKRAS